jgi:plastocyanin
MGTAVAVTGLSLLLAAGAVPSAAAATNAGTAAVVAVAPWRYSPNPLEISQGETLTFANFDSLSGEGHSLSQAVKPGGELFQSPITPPGTSSIVAGVDRLQKGEYRVTCRVHAFMNGKLIVR